MLVCEGSGASFALLAMICAAVYKGIDMGSCCLSDGRRSVFVQERGRESASAADKSRT